MDGRVGGNFSSAGGGFARSRLRQCAAIAASCACVLAACGWMEPQVSGSDAADEFRLGYGSCAVQWKEQPVWNTIAGSRPHAFVFLGDVVYADGVDMQAKRRAYAKLAAVPGFQALRRATLMLAVWDDHDFGHNDAGGDYPAKAASQRLFLDFFGEPSDSPRRKRPGIYQSYYFGNPPRRLQVILLDTRYFRDALERTEPRPPYRIAYRPTADRGKTLLGRAQWKWLEEELSKPADARVIASSIQLVAAEHQGEKWGNFPHEKARLYDLIQRTGAGGLVVISGDRHYAEFSVESRGAPYPVYDFTSSSLNSPWLPGAEEPNPARIDGPCAVPNYGMIIVDWKRRLIISEIRGADGGLLLKRSVPLRELRGRR